MDDETAVAEQIETDQPEAEQQAETHAEQAEQQGAPAEQAGDVEIKLAGEEPDPAEQEKQAPAWVREVRKRNRELERELKQLKTQQQTTAPQVPKVGPKPTLESMDYDVERYEQAHEKWQADKFKADQAEAQARAAKEQESKVWQGTLAAYEADKATVAKPDFADVEDEVRGALSEVQQGIILHVTDGKSAQFVYALGKSPKRLAVLAATKDPAKFAAEVGKALKDVTVTPAPKKPPPTETRPPRPAAAAGSQSLDDLKANAEKSGDWTKYFQAKRERAK